MHGLRKMMSSRNFRFMERNWEEIPLPYNLLSSTIINGRENTNSVAKMHNNVELYNVDIRNEWELVYKDYLMMILNELRFKIGELSVDVKLLSHHINDSQLLLGYDEKMYSKDNNFDKININGCEEFINDFIFEDDVTKTLIISKNDLASQIDNLSNAMLTHKDFGNLVEYVAYNNTAEYLQNKLTYNHNEKIGRAHV